MNNVAPIRAGEVVGLTGRQIALVRDTIAKDCSQEEFNLFVEVCRGLRLDPFRKQVFPLVFSKDKPDKRRMTIVVSRDGQRSIASRCGNYRPASEPAEIIFDEALKGPINPKGIVLARVKLWQQDKRGEWFPVIGEAYWDEFAPIAEEWAWDKDSGKRKPTGNMVLDPLGNWPRMPVVMITKCAEMQALRAGWPEEFGGVYGEEEMDRARVLDLNASEIVEHEAEGRRMRMIGAGNDLMVCWGADFGLERVPVGQFADRVIEHVGALEPAAVAKWRSMNAEPLREFWAKAPTDALELKKALEKAGAHR